MKPILTTITPYWGRPQQLAIWLRAMHDAGIPEVEHLIYVVGDEVMSTGDMSSRFRVYRCVPGDNLSIGHYHNLGAVAANTEWVMKLDVDALPNANYFQELVNVLKEAKKTEWFNGGMFYLNRRSINISTRKDPLSPANYDYILQNPRVFGVKSINNIGGSNFICRREVYLELGGCSERFKGWGWEDYQQLYMLERCQRSEDPLPGPLDISNVTKRCRDEIARPKAIELLQKSKWLCLLHRWHDNSASIANLYQSNANKQVLLDYIYKKR